MKTTEVYSMCAFRFYCVFPDLQTDHINSWHKPCLCNWKHPCSFYCSSSQELSVRG